MRPARAQQQPPCELAVHVVSPSVYIHPPPPRSRLPGKDQTLNGLVELMCPSERTIPAINVTLQGLQTIVFPDEAQPNGMRVEQKVVMNKSVEIVNATPSTSSPSEPSGSSTASSSAPAPGLPGSSPGGSPPTPVEMDSASADDVTSVAESQAPSHADDSAQGTARPRSATVTAPDLAHSKSSHVNEEGLHLTKGVHG